MTSNLEQVARSLPESGIDFGYCPVKSPTTKSFTINNPTQGTIRFTVQTGDPLFSLNMANGKLKFECRLSFECSHFVTNHQSNIACRFPWSQTEEGDKGYLWVRDCQGFNYYNAHQTSRGFRRAHFSFKTKRNWQVPLHHDWKHKLRLQFSIGWQDLF